MLLFPFRSGAPKKISPSVRPSALHRPQRQRRLFHSRCPLGYSSKKRTESPIVGIDLGTTNSCVAVLEDGRPVVLENDGKRTTPSVFAVDKNGNRLVGYPAIRQMVVNYRNTFFATKRLIGRRFSDPETKLLSKQVPFAIVPASNGDAWVADETGKKYSPEQIAANILIKLKEVASEHLGCNVERAVITVPAYFDNHQRQATEAAGRIAGLKVERIINEPTAAALAYGISRDEEKLVAVYDLGGGTFDISILEIGNGVFEVKSTSGDTFLGGEDFNAILATHITKAFEKKENVNISNDKIALQRIREAAETAKHSLSTLDSVRVSLPYLSVVGGVPKNFDLEIQRSMYENMVDSLIKKSLGPCQKALDDAGVTVDDITDVILVGGMTRMPKVREYVKAFFKKEPYAGINPDEAVAVGAVLQGGIISNKGLVSGSTSDREIILLDVTPLNLGTNVHSGEMVVIIPAQTPIPCTKAHTFTTVSDFQTSIRTQVFQGNRPIAKDNRLLGEYIVTGIPPAPAGIPKIDVTFTCSANGTITATSRDRAAGVDQGIVINTAGGLSNADIERMRREAQINEEADKKRFQTLQMIEKARKLISTIENSLIGSEKFSPNLQSKAKQVKTHSVELQTIINKSNVTLEEVDKLYKSLEELSKTFLTETYNLRAQNKS